MIDLTRYIRKLTIFLVVSGSLNILLLASLFYLAIRERPPAPYLELKPASVPLAAEHSDSEVIRYFRRMPLQWLISRLNNTQLVENGYTQRDLALASLVAFHYFDLERAFAKLPKPEQKKRIVFGQFRDGRSAEIIVYPELSDKHFEAVRTFAETERWPLTSRGLFLALQKEEKEEYDSHLLDAFFMTPEFSAVELLFSRSEKPVSKQELLKVVLEGNWDRLSDFVARQKQSQDLSQLRQRQFLLEYSANRSKAAAQLMLKIDADYAARKLDDNQVVMLLQLSDEKSPQAEQFAAALLSSPRSDAVLKLAAEYTGRNRPRKEATTAFAARVPDRKPTTTAAVQPKSKDVYYTVQEGDSLWKIGRRFGVEIEVLKAFNQLEGDTLRPGKILRIPGR
jgi:LysM domain